MEVYLIRHGETVWNAEGKLQGKSDIPLNENGRNVAKLTSEALKDTSFDVVYSSPLLRAKETAEIIVGAKKTKIVLDNRLMEIGFGECEGKNYQELKKSEEYSEFSNFFDAPEKFIPQEGGESIEELCIRSKSFIKDVLLEEQDKKKRVLIVAHGGLLASIMMQIKKLKVKEFWVAGVYKNCAVTRLLIENSNIKILDEGKILY